MIRRLPLAAALGLGVLGPVAFAQEAEEIWPKFGPDAVPITEQNAYLRENPAPDYWAFHAFVKPQFTTSACGIASVTAALNGLQGLPAAAEDTVITQQVQLEMAGLKQWSDVSAEGGDGVTFAQLESFTAAAVESRDMQDYEVTGWQPTGAEGDLDTLREMLAGNEAGADDALLIYFNQGVLTGDWDGPHVSVIGAYDAERGQVLVLDVDQEWYIPYWSPVEIVLEAMLRPTGPEHGVLEGETGGLVRVARR